MGRSNEMNSVQTAPIAKLRNVRTPKINDRPSFTLLVKYNVTNTTPTDARIEKLVGSADKTWSMLVGPGVNLAATPGLVCVVR